MKTEQNKANCVSCIHYDDDTHICTHGAGLLREIEMSESLAEADHGCKEYSEACYKITPQGLLQLALEDFNVRVSDKKIKPIFDRFMEYMIRNDYIEEKRKETC